MNIYAFLLRQNFCCECVSRQSAGYKELGRAYLDYMQQVVNNAGITRCSKTKLFETKKYDFKKNRREVVSKVENKKREIVWLVEEIVR